MGGVGGTYDTGALVAAERNNRQMWALHARDLAEEVIPAVPAPVLAEAWRGGSRQASLVGFSRMCDIEPMSEDLARHVGVLAGKSGHDDIVDVAVALQGADPPWGCHRDLECHAHQEGGGSSRCGVANRERLSRGMTEVLRHSRPSWPR